MIASFAITNSSGKTEFIVTDSMKIFSEKEALGLVASGAIQNLQIVKSNRGRYLRSKKNQSTRDNLDFRSITPTQFWTAYNDLSRRLDRAPLIQLEKIRNENIGIATDVIVVLWWDKQKNGYVDPRPTKTRASAINFLRANRRIIVQTAKRQNIDAAILGAILIDEYCRTGWEDSFDKMAAQLFTDRSFSIGIAQIKIDTAKTLIKQKYYTPDTKLDFSRPENRKALIAYLDEPTHSINFAAAAIRQDGRLSLVRLGIVQGIDNRWQRGASVGTELPKCSGGAAAHRHARITQRFGKPRNRNGCRSSNPTECVSGARTSRRILARERTVQLRYRRRTDRSQRAGRIMPNGSVIAAEPANVRANLPSLLVRLAERAAREQNRRRDRQYVTVHDQHGSTRSEFPDSRHSGH
jgi:hypothetical protein